MALTKKEPANEGRLFLFMALNLLSRPYSTVTDLARLRGLSTSVPRAQAV